MNSVCNAFAASDSFKERLDKASASLRWAIRARRDLHASLVVLSDICTQYSQVGDNARRGAQFNDFRRRMKAEIEKADQALVMFSELEFAMPTDGIATAGIEKRFGPLEHFGADWLQQTEALANEIRAVVPRCL